MSIAFIDLAAQQARIKDKIDARIQAVLAHGAYILGPEVTELEEKLSVFSGAKHAITCANGTDALLMALMALGIEEGDAVFIPAFTFVATAEVVPFVRATPVMVDVTPDTFNIDVASLERAVEFAKSQGLRPRVVIAVDLFGLPADYPAISAIAKKHDLTIIGDSAQSFGGSIEGQRTGSFGTITTTSFFPAKPLGCYGDGGAMFTNDDALADLLRSLRFHGKGHEKYDNVRIGNNSRLDTIQAAVLLEKLAIYEEEIFLRNKVAARYSSMISQRWQKPIVPEGYGSVWAQYTLVAKNAQAREDIIAKLRGQGIPTNVYYPRPLHQQTAFDGCMTDPEALGTSERLATTVFSLPMHPYLSEADQNRIIEALA